MRKRNRDNIVDELYFGETPSDSYEEHSDPELDLMNNIINNGEEDAREEFGDDAIDQILTKNHLAQRYNHKL